jgi:hypothetical protein
MPNPTFPHYALTGSQLHPPKLSDTAATQYSAFMTSGSIATFPETRGQTYFHNVATPRTITNPTSYTSIGATFTASGLAYRMTEGTAGTLLAASEGSGNRGMHITWSCVMEHDDAASQILYATLSIGGNVAGAERTQVWATLAPNVKKSFCATFQHTYANANTMEFEVKMGGGSGDILVSHAHITVSSTTT